MSRLRVGMLTTGFPRFEGDLFFRFWNRSLLNYFSIF